MTSKIVAIVVDGDAADEIGRLITSMLLLRGYGPHTPAIIDWPELDRIGLAAGRNSPLENEA